MPACGTFPSWAGSGKKALTLETDRQGIEPLQKSGRPLMKIGCEPWPSADDLVGY
jgi:hypothetical protein